MSAHRALLLDADGGFLALLRQSLEPCDFAIIQILDPAAPLEPFLADPPDVIFISVELPEKAGFSVFTRVRSLAKRVPIAMVTSSLSATEMSLHAKLRLHADLYVNKRVLDPALLLRTLRPLLPHVAELAGEESRYVPMRSLPDGTGSIPEWLSDGPEEGEVQAVLAGSFDEAVSEASGDLRDASGSATRRRIAELEAERNSLHAELDQARRDARSSPFSVEVVSLREEVNRCTAELSRLQFEVGHRDRELKESRRKLAEHVDELGAVLRERNDALVKLMQFEDQLEQAKHGIRRLEKQQLALKEASDAERARARHELAVQHEGDAEALLEAQLEVQRLRSTLRKVDENAASAEQAHADELTNLRVGHEQAFAAFENRWAARLEQTERDHAAAMQAARDQHRDELLALEDSHRGALVRTEREAAVVQNRSLRELEAQAAAQLGEARRAHAEELKALHEQRADELLKLGAGHREALARMEREHGTAMQQALAHQKARAEETVKEVGRAHADQLEAMRQRYERERNALAAEHTARMKQKEIDLQAAISQTVGDSRSDLERQLEQARQDHEETVASLQRRHADERRALEREREVDHKAKIDADTREAELQRVTLAQRANLESLEAALSNAESKAEAWASALAERERELADRAALIDSLEALVRDLQR